MRGHLCHFYLASLEHGVQFLLLAADAAQGPVPGRQSVPTVGLAAVLETGSALRHAGAGLERHDVGFRRLVFRGRFGSHHRFRPDGAVAGRRFLYRGRHRATRSVGGRLRHPRHAGGDSADRPTAVPPAGGLGRQVQVRIHRKPECTAIVVSGTAAAHPLDAGIDRAAGGVMGMVAVVHASATGLSPTCPNRDCGGGSIHGWIMGGWGCWARWRSPASCCSPVLF